MKNDFKHTRLGRSIIAPALPALLLAFLSLNCFETPPEPIMPYTDVQMSVPLINRIEYFSSLAEKDSTLTRVGTGEYVFSSKETAEPISIGSISVTPEPTTDQVALGLFQIGTLPPIGDSLTYQELTGFAPPPVPAPIPETTFPPLPETAFPPLTDIVSATFATGTMTLVFVNNLPFAVDFLDPIVLKNNQLTVPVDTNVVATFNFGATSVLPGQQVTSQVPLAGVTIQSALKMLQVRVHTPGTGSPVLIDPASGIKFEFSVTNATVTSARARIPEQEVFRDDTAMFVVDDSIAIQEAYFRSGSINLNFENTIDASVELFVWIQELQNRSTGIADTIKLAFNGVGTQSLPINLAQLRIQAGPAAQGTSLTYSLGITTLASQQIRQVNSTDYMRVTIQPTTAISLERISGKVTPVYTAVNSGATGVEIGEAADKFKGSLMFDSARVAISLGMSGGFVTDYDLRLVAMNRKGATAVVDSLVLPGTVQTGMHRFLPGSPTTIVLDNSNGFQTFISKFFPNLPDTFIVRGSMIVNPIDVYPTPQGVGSMTDTSKIYPAIDVSFPLRLGIAGGEFSDTSDIGDDDKVDKDLATSATQGTVYFEINNAMPLELSFRAALLRRDTLGGAPDTLLFLPPDGPRTILPAPVDPTGYVTGPQLSVFSITLTGPQISLLDSSNVIWYRFGIQTTGGGTSAVRVRDSDYIHIRASANLVLTVNKP